MHGGDILTGSLLLVCIASVASQKETKVRIAGPENNVTFTTKGPVKIIICDTPPASKLIGTSNIIIKHKPSSSSNSHTSLLPHEDCPEDAGFFLSPGSNQCLKAFLEPDQEGFWEDADRTCKAAGLVLAKPADPVSLRSLLVDKYGDKSYWVGARGDGRHMQWQGDSGVLGISSPFWQPGIDENYISTDDCLGLSVNDYVLREYPDQPYWSWDCALRYAKFPLCELV